MRDYTELRNQLYKELDKIADKGEVTNATLDSIEKLACAIKKLAEIEMLNEDNRYSGNRMPMRSTYSVERRPMRGYSGNDDYAMRLEELMYNSPDDRTRSEIEHILSHMR